MATTSVLFFILDHSLWESRLFTKNCAKIYLNIAKDTALVSAYPNALWTAKDAYLKARELDVKGNYDREIITGLGLVQTTAANQGINDYSSEVYDQAAGKFDLSAEIAGMFDVLDTMGIFNAALCYEKSNNWPRV